MNKIDKAENVFEKIAGISLKKGLGVIDRGMAPISKSVAKSFDKNVLNSTADQYKKYEALQELNKTKGLNLSETDMKGFLAKNKNTGLSLKDYSKERVEKANRIMTMQKNRIAGNITLQPQDKSFLENMHGTSPLKQKMGDKTFSRNLKDVSKGKTHLAPTDIDLMEKQKMTDLKTVSKNETVKMPKPFSTKKMNKVKKSDMPSVGIVDQSKTKADNLMNKIKTNPMYAAGAAGLGGGALGYALSNTQKSEY